MSKTFKEIVPEGLKAYATALTENFSEKLMIIMIERLGGSLTVTEKEIDIEHKSSKMMMIRLEDGMFKIWVEDKPI